MQNLQDITLIVPLNDLESKTIIEVAQRLGFRGNRLIIPRNMNWGARLENVSSEDFDRIKTNKVWIVELPGLEKEKELEKKGLEITKIDHHIYGDTSDRSHNKSSLEQFAALCGYELSPHEKLVAINDRSYIWGLIDEANLTFEQIAEIRRADFRAQGISDEEIKSAEDEFSKIKIKNGSSCTVPFFYFESNSNIIGPMIDLYHFPNAETLELYKKDSDNYPFLNVMVWSSSKKNIFCSGGFEYIKQVKDFLIPLAEECWSGGDHKTGYFGAKLKSPQTGCFKNTNHLNMAPVQKFTSIFLFPFRLRKDVRPTENDKWVLQTYKIPKHPGELKEKENWEYRQNYAEYIYFHDYVRPFLFNTSKKANKVTSKSAFFYKYQLEKPAIVDLEYANQNSKPNNTISAFITGIAVHFYPGDIGILMIRVSSSPDHELNFNEMRSAGASNVTNASQVLLFNNMFRRLYPAYFEKDDFNALDRDQPEEEKSRLVINQMKNRDYPAKISIKQPFNVKEPFNFYWEFDANEVYFNEITHDKLKEPHHYPSMKGHSVSHLLDSLLMYDIKKKTDSQKFIPIIDDRMLVFTYVAFAPFLKNFVSKKAQQVYFSLLLYVDNPANNYRYNPEFIEKNMDKIINTRWFHRCTLAGYTRYSGAKQTFGHQDFLYRPFLSMYYQMYLLATYYRSRLILFSSKIGDLSRGLSYCLKENKGNLDFDLKNDFRDIRCRFMEFMNQQWFDELTPQEQGIEEYRIIQKAFELSPMYIQVREEIERADDLIGLFHNKSIEGFNTKLGFSGLVFALVAMITGYFEINFEEVSANSVFPGLYWKSFITSLLYSGLLVVSVFLIFHAKITKIKYWPIIFLILFVIILFIFYEVLPFN